MHYIEKCLTKPMFFMLMAGTLFFSPCVNPVMALYPIHWQDNYRGSYKKSTPESIKNNLCRPVSAVTETTCSTHTSWSPSLPCILPVCPLPVSRAVSGSNNGQKIEKPQGKHPFSIEKEHPSTSGQSQKQAIHFVVTQWAHHPKGHHYHLLASDELKSLEKAYQDQFFVPIPGGKNGQLMNTAPFTLTQVYSAYYMAVAAEESLDSLKVYEQTERDDKKTENMSKPL